MRVSRFSARLPSLNSGRCQTRVSLLRHTLCLRLLLLLLAAARRLLPCRQSPLHQHLCMRRLRRSRKRPSSLPLCSLPLCSSSSSSSSCRIHRPSRAPHAPPSSSFSPCPHHHGPNPSQ